MRVFNLDSYISVFQMNENDAKLSFLKMTDYGYWRTGNIKINQEHESLAVLANLLNKHLTVKQKSGFFLGYKIESKIDEEFDLLRFSDDVILNIELKSTLPNGGLDSIEDQLKRHKFVLSILDKKVMSFTFISDEKKLYMIDEEEGFFEVTIEKLIDAIPEDYIRINEMENIDLNKFIISPYSDTDDFINHRYYLNQDQRNKKLEVKNSEQPRIFIEGHAGTGKSLLLFDLAKEMHDEGKNVLLLFCGMLSNWSTLSEKFGFTIRPIKNFKSFINEADYVFIDETQRIHIEQWNTLLEEYPEKKFYFAYDTRQVLSWREKNRIDFNKFKKNPEVNKFIELKQKIRTNREMIAFIEKVLNLSVRYHDNYDYNNVDIAHFDNKDAAAKFIESLKDDGYQSIELTQYKTKTTQDLKRKNISNMSYGVHDVIGREYESVVVIIDHHFEYDENGILRSNYPDYYPYLESEGIYQALTRVKKHLYLVIVNNPNIYVKIQSVITRKLENIMEKNK